MIAKLTTTTHREPDLVAKLNEVIDAIESIDKRLKAVEQRQRIGHKANATAERRWAKRRKDEA
jgi:hypothetical protein